MKKQNEQYNKNKKKGLQIYNEFTEDLSNFLEKWRDNLDLPSELLEAGLLFEARMEACWNYSSYFEMLGSLNHMTHHGLKEMFDDIQKFKKQEKEKINEKTLENN